MAIADFQVACAKRNSFCHIHGLPMDERSPDLGGQELGGQLRGATKGCTIG
jgi:hypothetical protein